jgi:hypothetical protein
MDNKFKLGFIEHCIDNNLGLHQIEDLVQKQACVDIFDSPSVSKGFTSEVGEIRTSNMTQFEKAACIKKTFDKLLTEVGTEKQGNAKLISQLLAGGGAGAGIGAMSDDGEGGSRALEGLLAGIGAVGGGKMGLGGAKAVGKKIMPTKSSPIPFHPRELPGEAGASSNQKLIAALSTILAGGAGAGGAGAGLIGGFGAGKALS